MATILSMPILLNIFIVLFSNVKSEPSTALTCLATSTPEERKCLHRLYGTKTTYTDAYDYINEDSRQELRIPSTCTPQSLYLFKRHGIRYPDGEDVPEMERTLNGIRDAIVTAFDQGRTGLCREDIDILRNWNLGIKPEDDNLITEHGFTETKRIGM